MMMKLAVLAVLATSASAFSPPALTFAVGKKKAPVKTVSATRAIKKAPVKKRVVPKAKSTYKAGVVPSASIPYEEAPAILDGSMVGDVGFDPCFLATKADSMADYFNGLFGTNIDGLTWYREAELMHGRICMLAVLGFIVPGLTHFPGNDWAGGVDAYNYPNPLEAWGAAPFPALFQVFFFMMFMEFRRINIILEKGNRYQAGASQNWGQGAWNPFNLNYSPAEYAEKQLQEVKHARLAMIGFLGLVFQANASGVGVVEQWGRALVGPEYFNKAGYYFPDGI